MTTICYHANCADGFGAAFAAWLVYGERPGVRYIPVSYGDPVPDMPPGDGPHTVYILDFSWPRTALEELAARPEVESVTVIDHHETAQAELAGIPWIDINFPRVAKLRALFDMERSGAALAWIHFHDSIVPDLIRYVQDRDLWTWRLVFSRAINAALWQKKNMHFDTWRNLIATWNSVARERLMMEGSAILGNQEAMLDTMARHAEGMIDSHGRAFIRCNSHVLQSELAERLLKDDPDAVYADVWYEYRGARVHSLRSRREDEDVNVSAIAKSYGGGGHRCAAGYWESPEQILTRYSAN